MLHININIGFSSVKNIQNKYAIVPNINPFTINNCGIKNIIAIRISMQLFDIIRKLYASIICSLRAYMINDVSIIEPKISQIIIVYINCIFGIATGISIPVSIIPAQIHNAKIGHIANTAFIALHANSNMLYVGKILFFSLQTLFIVFISIVASIKKVNGANTKNMPIFPFENKI